MRNVYRHALLSFAVLVLTACGNDYQLPFATDGEGKQIVIENQTTQQQVANMDGCFNAQFELVLENSLFELIQDHLNNSATDRLLIKLGGDLKLYASDENDPNRQMYFQANQERVTLVYNETGDQLANLLTNSSNQQLLDLSIYLGDDDEAAYSSSIIPDVNGMGVNSDNCELLNYTKYAQILDGEELD
jgi:hypothetical protein